MELVKVFLEKYFKSEIPCSFLYDGKRVKGDFGGLTEGKETDEIKRYARVFRTEHLTATLNIAVFKKHGAVEWWMDLSAEGMYDSGLVEDIRFCDIKISAPEMDQEHCTQYPCMHWAKGSRASAWDFQMQTESFWPFRNDPSVYESDFGRSSSGCMPYFNLQTAAESGVILAIGWSGQWQMSVTRNPVKGMTQIELQGCMDRTSFRVRSKETLSLPHMLAFPWEGMDLEASYNGFRALLLEQAPKANGKLPVPPVCISTWGGAGRDYHKRAIRVIKECGIDADVYWMDAGWFGSGEEVSELEFRDSWYYNVGAWEPLRQLYPDGMEEIGRCVTEAGMKFLLWFEPERAVSRLPVVIEHRDYFIGPKLPFNPEPSHEGARTPYSLMLNLGNEDARHYIVEALAKFIMNCHVSYLRIDFNYEPLWYWRYHDSEERWGVTEIKYINGLYKMLDELKSRFPHLEIDNCASGGRRLDYRMFRRAIPLFMTDYFCAGDHKNAAVQLQNFQLARWLPIHGAMAGDRRSDYAFRSHLAPASGFDWSADEETLRKLAPWYARMAEQAKRAGKLLMKDLYLLTEDGISEKAWFAYEAFDRDEEKGLVLAFRRKENGMPEQSFLLKGLVETAVYRLEDADSGEIGVLSGKTLSKGLKLKASQSGSSVLLFFERI
ncbi:MAG: alpha-galactosidase [Lachnospiraceae bacterium]|jgi:alpha-galactosidase|nr:alpha-galactosidase [Lachnospiraceae bacterium]